MINVGAEHLIAEAVIALALYENLTVFVTVSDDDEAVFFMKKFPQVVFFTVALILVYLIDPP